MIIDRDELERRVGEGLIRRQTNGSLFIYNYTEAAQFSRAWDDYTLMARGLILDANGTVIAKPWGKFFNLGEPSCPSLPDLPYDVFEKLDGSLGIWYHHDGAWRVATRGSFENEYTAYAQQFAPLLADMAETVTVLTEICMPSDADGMPRAVDHTPGVYLLGAVNRVCGDDICPRIAREYWRGTMAAKWEGNESIETFLHRALEQEGMEGWVIRYADGTRVKIKTSWYLRLFRAISNLTEKHIRELMLDGGTEWLKDFPEELRDDAEAIYCRIRDRFQDRYARIRSVFEQHACLPDRKSFALAVNGDPDRAFLFLLLDGKDITKKLLLEC